MITKLVSRDTLHALAPLPVPDKQDTQEKRNNMLQLNEPCQMFIRTADSSQVEKTKLQERIQLYVGCAMDLEYKTIFQDELVSEVCCCTKRDKTTNLLEYTRNETTQEKASAAEENNSQPFSDLPN